MVLAGLGCGGDDDDEGSDVSDASETTDSGEPLDEDEYEEALCDALVEADEDLSDAPGDLDGDPDAVEADDVSERVEISADFHAQIDGLTPPEDLQDVHDEIVEFASGDVSLYEDLEAAAQDGDEDEIEEAQEELYEEDPELGAEALDLLESCFGNS